MEGELVLDEEAVVDAAEAMEIKGEFGSAFLKSA